MFSGSTALMLATETKCVYLIPCRNKLDIGRPGFDSQRPTIASEIGNCTLNSVVMNFLVLFLIEVSSWQYFIVWIRWWLKQFMIISLISMIGENYLLIHLNTSTLSGKSQTLIIIVITLQLHISLWELNNITE